jgi:hypothetical protein
MKKITYEDFEKILNIEIDESLKTRIKDLDLKYRDLTQEERDEYILNNLNILTNDITVSGKHRINEWESGWEENLNLFKSTKNINDLIPKYHGKNRVVKWMGDVVMPITENFDYKIHICFVDAIVGHYLKDVTNIFELGCGPAYHLVRLNEYNKNINLYGTDWATSSQKIIVEINKVLDLNINPINLDFFNPNYEIEIPKNTGIYTVASLEQIGTGYKKIVDFLIDKKPKICVHMEPIGELLDDNKLIDSLSIKYFKKRNYLNGYLTYLETLESQGKIEIINKQRIYSGSYFVEGHSLIVWRPI